MKRLAISLVTAALLQIGANTPASADTLTVNISAATDFYMTAGVGQVISAQTNLTQGDSTLWLYFGTTNVVYADDNNQNLNGNGLNSIFSYTVPAGGAGTYRLRAAQYNNEAGTNMSARYSLYISAPGAISYTSSDTTAPTVSSITFSSAGADNTFITGDVITATVNWSEAVNVTGSPRIPILGLTSKYLIYASGTGTTATTFTYTVVSGDTDTDGIALTASTLELNSGTIKDATGNNATLTHSAVLASASLKVDTTNPVHSSSAVNTAGTQLTMTYGEALSSTTAATSAFAVVAAGSSVTVSSATVSGSTVVLALASTVRIGQVVTVAYTDPTAGNDASAVQDVGGNDASSLSATSVTNNSTVKQIQATFTFAGGSTTYGTNLRLQSSGGSGTGAISYAVSSGSCAVSNTDSLTSSSAGSCVVVARKATDSTYLDAYDTKTVTISKASQAKLTIGQYTAFVGVSTYPINVYGGSGTGAISRTLSAPGSANCTLQSGLFVQAASVGSCTITAVKAADTNYLAETTTAAIYWVQWSDAYATRVPSVPTGIDLLHKTQITKYNFETLTVTSYKDGFGNPVTSITANSQLRIIGDGFNAADTTTEVVFGNAEIVDMNYSSPALQVVSDGSGGYYLLVTVPSGAGTDNVVVNSAKGTAMGPVLTIL